MTAAKHSYEHEYYITYYTLSRTQIIYIYINAANIGLYFLVGVKASIFCLLCLFFETSEGSHYPNGTALIPETGGS